MPFHTFLVGFRFTRTSCGAVLPIRRMGTAFEKIICKFLCEKSFANKFFEKLFAKIFFEKSFNFYRKANVDHQVLVVGGLGANLVKKCKIVFINAFDLYLVGHLVGIAR